MKKHLMYFISLALLVALTATLSLPGGIARYVHSESGMAGAINFTNAQRTDIFYVEHELSKKEDLWSNEYKDADGTLTEPTNAILQEFDIEHTKDITYPMVNVADVPVYCSFAIAFCAMDYTQIKHQGKNQLLVNYTVTMTVTRSTGEHLTLTIEGKLKTDLDPQADGLGAVNLVMDLDAGPQYYGKSTGNTAPYMIYRATVSPTLETMIDGDQSAMTITDQNGGPRKATAENFVIYPGDSADCRITLEFDGSFQAQTNAKACYASVGLVAGPVN